MKETLTLTIGTKIKVTFFANSSHGGGSGSCDQGERKTLEGVVVKGATWSEKSAQYSVTLETANGFRSFPCQTVSSLAIL
jgi:hypothetical protein